MPVTRVPLGEPDGRERWTVTHDGRDYLVIEIGGELVVTDLLCPHKQTSLVDGLLRDGCLVCPGHWYAFDLTNGQCRNANETSLRLHPVAEIDGQRFAEVTHVPELSWSERLRSHAKGSS